MWRNPRALAAPIASSAASYRAASWRTQFFLSPAPMSCTGTTAGCSGRVMVGDWRWKSRTAASGWMGSSVVRGERSAARGGGRALVGRALTFTPMPPGGSRCRPRSRSVGPRRPMAPRQLRPAPPSRAASASRRTCVDALGLQPRVVEGTGRATGCRRWHRSSCRRWCRLPRDGVPGKGATQTPAADTPPPQSRPSAASGGGWESGGTAPVVVTFSGECLPPPKPQRLASCSRGGRVARCPCASARSCS